MSLPGRTIAVADRREVARAAADFLRGYALASVRERGVFHVALSGGSTPRPILRRMQEDADFPWGETTFWWLDERCVPPAHEQSNYGMAVSQAPRLLELPERVLRMRGEDDPGEAAASYARLLDSAAPKSGDGWPVLDLILLGLGPDGHVASLFPGLDGMGVRDRSVVAQYVPGMDSWRLSLTMPVINSARCCLFVASGAAKRPVLERLARDDAADLPLAEVRPGAGELVWIVDGDACPGEGDHDDH